MVAQTMFHTCKGKLSYFGVEIKIDDDVDVNKCFNQIKSSI